MTGERALKSYLAGFPISYFTHHDDIRVMPKHIPQSTGKREASRFIHLHLFDAFYVVLDGVLHGKNVDALGT